MPDSIKKVPNACAALSKPRCPMPNGGALGNTGIFTHLWMENEQNQGQRNVILYNTIILHKNII